MVQALMQQAVKKMTDAGKHMRTAIDLELFQKVRPVRERWSGSGVPERWFVGDRRVLGENGTPSLPPYLAPPVRTHRSPRAPTRPRRRKWRRRSGRSCR